MENRFDSKPAVKLALCVPSLGEWKAGFAMSFAQMCVHLTSNLFEADQSRQIIVSEKRSSCLCSSRQMMLQDAMMQDCTHALFLDSDQMFPQDVAHRLMAHKKPVVAANIALKTIPSFPTARLRGATSFGAPLTSGPDRHGLERVWRIGTGIMLIDLSIMRDIPLPWFEVRWDHEAKLHVTEDWYLCALFEKHGHEIYIDHDLSREVGHVGDFNYTHVNIPQLPAELAAA